MSEPVTRQRPSVDLDDFERRLRQSNAHLGDHDEDPLAELARLVGEQRDPYEDVFAQEAVASARGQGAYQAPARSPEAAPPFPTNFAAIEAGLRGGFSPHGDEHAYQDQAGYQDQHRYMDPQGQYAGYEDPAYAVQPDPSAYAPPVKSRRPVYLMAATIVVGVLGVGGAFALKGHATNPSDVKTILADSGPTKIQPPADASSDQNSQDSSVLGKGNQTAPTKLVGNVEEPVDVSQAVTESPAPSSGDASSIPVPPTPGQASSAPQAAGDPGAASTDGPDFAAGMPAPKKVKIISVRPDGTILSGDQTASTPPATDTPPPPQQDIAAALPMDPAAALGPDMSGAPPSDAAAVKPLSSKSKPKSVTRVEPKHVADRPADDGDDAPAPPKPTHKAKSKPTKIAMADPTDSPTEITPSAKATGGGGFAVQLAAPGSEAEARSASSRLAKKYSSDLGGRHLGFFKAQSNGKSVFRVRVSSLSKDEALSLCEKLKSDGGTCFVAKN